MAMRQLVFWTVMATCSQWAALGSAQQAAAPTSARVAALFMASELSAADPKPLSTTHSSAQRAQLQRARWLLASGIGLTVGSAAGVAAAGRSTYCSYQGLAPDKTAPRTLAGVFGAAGLGVTALGAVRLATVPAEARPRPRARQQLGLAAGAVALSTVSFFLIALSTVPEWSRCWNS